MDEDAYLPIEDYGVIGNLETCALVSSEGSIDWFPFPHLESPSIFAAILDAERGGRFRIGPSDRSSGTQQYVPRTNVLETTFRTENGTATVTDFLPPAHGVDWPTNVLYRKISCTAGTVDVEIEFEPRFDYARGKTVIEETNGDVTAEGGGERTVLESTVTLDVRHGRATGEMALEAGETEWVLLRGTGAEYAPAAPADALAETIEYWRNWAHECEGRSDCPFDGPWHDVVVRSELVLKLLTHEETGAVAAAPTTSLPEEIGGVRNWDYRYNWLRDAGFTVQALSNLGHAQAAFEYVNWFLELCKDVEPSAIQPLYGLHGAVDLREEELDHLEGYRRSRPVRIGNAAVDQRQLDIYGELLLATDEMLQENLVLAAEDWETIRDIVNYVQDIWNEPDSGIWEVRDRPKQYVYSKVLCWVALDRGIAIAVEDGHDAPLDDWRDTRETIKQTVLERGYDEDLDTFVQSYDSKVVDATGLLFPIVGFLPFGDDRVQNTIDAVQRRLVEDEVLVKRYDGDDGLPGSEGAFVLCSCWLVDALLLSGRVEAAVDRFEALVEYVNPLGLLSEELDTATGHYLGNYPQGFSHIGIVNSALYVGYARGHELPGPTPIGIRLGDPVTLDDE